jgi:spore coat protein A
MVRLNRRDFLRQFGASIPALALQTTGVAQQAQDGNLNRRNYRIATNLQPFKDPLPILKTLPAQDRHKGELRYHIRMVEFQKQIHSDLPPTRLWGYDGQYPGPIIEAIRGTPITVRWENRLPTNHLFKVDPHIHGAMPPVPEVRTVPHLHGARLRSRDDGLPENWFTPGTARTYSYGNEQAAATLWYHDHAIGITRLNVYAGLSGFFLLRDPDELAMHLPSGPYEIPIILQDRTLAEDGQLTYAPAFDDEVELPEGVWGSEFFGELPVINGAVSPYLEVEARPYRLRALNGANSRFFNLSFNLAERPTDIPSLLSFHAIGSDGGFLPRPVKLQSLLLAPAERADLIVDFSGLENRTVTLSNNAAAPYPNWASTAPVRKPIYELMQFRVNRALSGARKQFLMTAPTPFVPLNEAASIRTRDFILTDKMDAKGRSLGMKINSKGYRDPVTETVTLGTTEKWRFINTTEDAHPMHLHLVQFQVLHRQGFNPISLQKGFLELVGIVRPPAGNEAGWKDTAVVDPGEVLTILVRFDGYTGKYVFHCHMLEHEDNDMMRPYVVISGEAKADQ